MINVAYKLQAVKKNAASGMVFIKLLGDDGFDWVVSNRQGAPEGMTYIAGMNNGSFRFIDVNSLSKVFFNPLAADHGIDCGQFDIKPDGVYIEGALIDKAFMASGAYYLQCESVEQAAQVRKMIEEA